jgi:SpoVK/Ycf46/Vps4 family AAA+-type ATPase
MAATALKSDVLLSALRRLDALLVPAVERARTIYGPEAADPFRGLHIRAADAERLLGQAPGEALLWSGGLDCDVPAFAEVETRLGIAHLDSFDRDVLLLSLAPEIDQRYDRVYAFLQDDITRRRPTVDLALNLLCATPTARIARRAHFGPDAPLLRQGLVDLVADPNQVEPTLLARYITPDEQVVGALLGQSPLDRRLATSAKLVTPRDSLEVLGDLNQAIFVAPARIALVGADAVACQESAEALAAARGQRLLTVDLGRALERETAPEPVLRRVFREAWLHDALLYLYGIDGLLATSETARRALADELAASRGVTILSASQAWRPLFASSAEHSLGLLHVEIGAADFTRRRATWAASLAAEHCPPLADADLDTLADRFRLSPSQIRESVALTCASSRPADLPALLVAARAQSGHDLASLAVKIEPTYHWPDLVLPADAMAQLRELCHRVSLRHHVFETWGFGSRVSLGGGVSALFAGPSGTGKTMAAEIVAAELGVDLYRINLAGVVSKYIGETEKNLDRIFDAADQANAILFFDEADALFGKRSEVRDSHDRYANIEISYLLQKMEQYTGVAILATNLRANLDEAFTRRMAFSIHFPFPDEHYRRRIWGGIWPANLPLAPDVDQDYLAREFPLTGGNIRNIAMAAAFLAAGEACPVGMSHLFLAVRREYQKMGKHMAERELGEAYERVAGR